MEKIISISDSGFSNKQDYYNDGYDGFVIVTDEQTIKIGITNGQSCCENWAVDSEPSENLEQFVGAEILDIVESNVNVEGVGEPSEGGIYTVDIITSVGTLKITMSNSHNGYYSHGAIVESNQLKESTSL